jgi:hypothetical protein
MAILVAIWLLIGAGVLVWLLCDRDVRRDVFSWPAGDIGGYMLFIVLCWPIVLMPGSEER